MPARPPFWTYMIDAIGYGILLALIFILRRMLQNCMSKSKFVNGRSRRDARRTVDVEHQTRASLMWHHRHPAAKMKPLRMTHSHQQTINDVQTQCPTGSRIPKREVFDQVQSINQQLCRLENI